MALDLQLFREKLLLRREMLLAQDEMSKEGRAPVALEQDSVGRLSRIDAMQIQAMALAQQRRRDTERAAIAIALKRIEDSEFGYCLTCGEEIAEARLLNLPSVTTCIECARK